MTAHDTVITVVLEKYIAAVQWRTEWGGGLGGSKPPPPPEIPKAPQNHAKLSPTVKTVKNCWI